MADPLKVADPTKPEGPKMKSFEITTPDGRTFDVQAPEGTPQDKVLQVVYEQSQKLGMFKEPEKKPEDRTFFDRLKDFHAENKAAQAKLQNPVIGAVEGALPSAMTAATIPLTGVGGQIASKIAPAVPKAAALVGEALTQGGLTAAQTALEGGSKEHALHTGGLSAATSLATGGLLSRIPAAKHNGLTKPIRELVADFGDREKAYKYASDAIRTAFDKVADRIPRGSWMNLPSLDRAKRLTSKEAQAALEKLEGVEYEIARKEIISELNRLDIGNLPKKMLGGQPKNPRASYAGQEFEARTSPFRQKPTPRPDEKTALNVTRMLPMVRAAAETAMTRPVEDTGGVPFGALALNALVNKTPLKHVPGAGVLKDVVGDETE